MKAYIHHRTDAEDGKDVTNYWFTFNPESAESWQHRRAAEDAQSFFERVPITIPTREGSHRLPGFQIEEVKPDKFIICCDGPFELMEFGTPHPYRSYS